MVFINTVEELENVLLEINIGDRNKEKLRLIIKNFKFNKEDVSKNKFKLTCKHCEQNINFYITREDYVDKIENHLKSSYHKDSISKKLTINEILKSINKSSKEKKKAQKIDLEDIICIDDENQNNKDRIKQNGQKESNSLNDLEKQLYYKDNQLKIMQMVIDSLKKENEGLKNLMNENQISYCDLKDENQALKDENQALKDKLKSSDEKNFKLSKEISKLKQISNIKNEYEIEFLDDDNVKPMCSQFRPDHKNLTLSQSNITKLPILSKGRKVNETNDKLDVKRPRISTNDEY